jgi:succinyl-CoA synthetase alpha subunit
MRAAGITVVEGPHLLGRAMKELLARGGKPARRPPRERRASPDRRAAKDRRAAEDAAEAGAKSAAGGARVAKPAKKG